MNGECQKCGEHALECKCHVPFSLGDREFCSQCGGLECVCEIESLIPLPLPFDPNAKIFNCVNEETGEVLGKPYSYNDFIDKIINISGINEELLGER